MIERGDVIGVILGELLACYKHLKSWWQIIDVDDTFWMLVQCAKSTLCWNIDIGDNKKKSLSCRQQISVSTSVTNVINVLISWYCSVYPDTCNGLGLHNLYKICNKKGSSSEENWRNSEGAIWNTRSTRTYYDGSNRSR